MLVILLLCAALGGCAQPAHEPAPAVAAAATNGNAPSPYDISGVLKRGESATHVLSIDVAAPVMFLLVSTPGDVELVMTSPSGKKFSSHHPKTDEEGGHVSEFPDLPVGPMSMVHVEVPEIGQWTAKVIALSKPDSLPAIAYSLEVEQQTGTNGPVLSSRVPERTYHRGEQLAVRASLLEHGTPVEGATVQALSGLPDGEPTRLTLRDDGVAPDSARGDGFYAADLPPFASDGLYDLRIVAERPGTFRRTVSQVLRVSRSNSRLTGRYMDTLRDSDHDGVPDQLVISAGVQVSEPAKLGIVAYLSGAHGPVYYGRADVALAPAGNQTIDVVWELEDLLEKSGPGSFTLDSLFLFEEEDMDSPLYVFDDLRERVHTTRSYTAGELIYKPIYAASKATARGIDDNRDGRSDVMEVELPMNLRASGLYAWHVVVFAAHGGIVTQGSGVRLLSQGQTNVRFPFPGACMAGGPAGAKYTIDFSINFVPRPPVPPNAPREAYERDDIPLEGVPAPSKFDPTERPEIRPKEFKTRDEYQSIHCG